MNLCVFGCLLTDYGMQIKQEMLSWLSTEYKVFCVDQEPPGTLFEYPGIYYAAKLAIDANYPVLYVHTKGAANKIPSYHTKMMSSKFNVPSHAKPEDCQRVIRNLWRHEFTGNRLYEYLRAVNVNTPMVACPYTGPSKTTWWNGFIINPLAAKILLPKLQISTYRWYYERLFANFADIQVCGLRRNNLTFDTIDNDIPYWNDIWSFYNT